MSRIEVQVPRSSCAEAQFEADSSSGVDLEELACEREQPGGEDHGVWAGLHQGGGWHSWLEEWVFMKF